MAVIVWTNWVIMPIRGATTVKNKLKKLLRPHMGVYFSVMGVFAILSLLMQQYWLGAIQGTAAALLLLCTIWTEPTAARNCKSFCRRRKIPRNPPARATAPSRR